SRGGLYCRRSSGTDVLRLRFPRAREDQRSEGALGARILWPRRQRRLVLLGLLQPRRDAPRFAVGGARSRPAGLPEGGVGAADVAARICLPLPGRGARLRRGGTDLRGPA